MFEESRLLGDSSHAQPDSTDLQLIARGRNPTDLQVIAHSQEFGRRPNSG